MRRAVTGRGYAKHSSKCPRERFVRLEACRERDFGDWAIVLFECLGGALQPQAADVLLQRFPHQAPKNTMEMEPREGGDGRQILQFQLVIQMALDVDERSHDPLVVILFGRQFHERASREAQNPNAGQLSARSPRRARTRRV
jgi:hypothetical protein